MKLNVDDISERNRIVNSFIVPLRHIPLIASDMADHKRQILKVYKGMLREACVIDDCRRRFETMFREPMFWIERN